MNRSRSRLLVASAVAITLALGCSAGDPPNPDAARTSTTAAADGGEPASEGEADLPEINGPADAEATHAEEGEVSAADDATLDALEEQFEDRGVKDIRGEPATGVTIRLEDELTIGDAGPVCAAVRAAGFAEVHVDIDDAVAPCP